MIEKGLDVNHQFKMDGKKPFTRKDYTPYVTHVDCGDKSLPRAAVSNVENFRTVRCTYEYTKPERLENSNPVQSIVFFALTLPAFGPICRISVHMYTHTNE